MAMRCERLVVLGLGLSSALCVVASCRSGDPVSAPAVGSVASTTAVGSTGAPGTTSTSSGANGTTPPGSGALVASGDFCADLRTAAELGALHGGSRSFPDGAETTSKASSDADKEQVLAFFLALVGEAPNELHDDVETVQKTVAGLADLPSGEDGLGKAFGLLLDPRFTASATRINQHARTTCGLTKDPIPSDTGSSSTESSVPGSGSTGGTERPSFGDRFEAAYEHEPWWPKKTGYAYSGFGSDLSVEIYGDFDRDEALAVCRAVEELLGKPTQNLKIVVKQADANTVPLAARDDTAGAACVAG